MVVLHKDLLLRSVVSMTDGAERISPIQTSSSSGVAAVRVETCGGYVSWLEKFLRNILRLVIHPYALLHDGAGTVRKARSNVGSLKGERHHTPGAI